MDTKKWTKKDKIACIVIFTICILTFIVFLSTMTLSYFYDDHSANGLIVAGEVKIKTIGGPTNNGQIQFPEILIPNTQYKVADYKTDSNYNLAYEVVNESTSGAVFVMLKLESDYFGIIKPTLKSQINGDYWVTGENNSQYLYYMRPLDVGQQASLCDSWQVGNYTNALNGRAVNYKITAYAVQIQGTAVDELIASNVDGWQYAPQIFKDMTANY